MPIGYILINCENFHEDYVIEQLKKINSVHDIQGVFGIYDIIVTVQEKNKNVFTNIISTQIQKIDKLKSTLTLMVSNSDG